MQLLGSDLFPRLAQVSRKLFVGDAREFDPYPTRRTYVWRAIEFLWVGFNQSRLNSDSRRYGYSDVAIVMMIDRTGGEDALFNKESRLAVREFFPSLGERKAESTHSLDVLFRIRSGHSLLRIL